MRDRDDARRACRHCRLDCAPVRTLATTVVTRTVTVLSAAVFGTGADAAADDADGADAER